MSLGELGNTCHLVPLSEDLIIFPCWKQKLFFPAQTMNNNLPGYSEAVCVSMYYRHPWFVDDIIPDAKPECGITRLRTQQAT